jgi:hypothetical protein
MRDIYPEAIPTLAMSTNSGSATGRNRVETGELCERHKPAGPGGEFANSRQGLFLIFDLCLLPFDF